MTDLRTEREKAGFTQAELSAASGVPQGVISDIESGVTANPRFETVRKLAMVLHFDVCSLALGRTESEQTDDSRAS